VIAADYPYGVEGCCKRMFEKWLTTQIDPSWSQLIEALKITGLCYVASQIEERIQGKHTCFKEYSLLLYVVQ